MRFQEDFLHFIWQFRLFNTLKLFTTDQQHITILQPGTINKNAGPDFINARLIIGDTTWVGNIEIHINSSDWNQHHHQKDSAYDNVILHVVYQNNEPIYRKDGTLIPTLILKDIFPNTLLNNYQQLITSPNKFPCQQQINSVDEFLINGFLSRILVERLEEKSELVVQKLKELKGDWDETFYHFMAKNFGFKVNAIPMEMLAQSLPQQLFAKHKDQPLQIEALIFGQAGFLKQNFEEDYPNQLKREYQFLQKKYNLKPLDVSIWKFMRMRPQNFPTLRLAQFAALIINSNHLFSKILTIKNGKEYLELFDQLPINPFWKTHYHFNKKTENVALTLGKASVENILINTLSLFLFAYGKFIDQHNYITRALTLLENITLENNAIVKQYLEAGVQVKNAYQSQAVLQLKRGYCDQKKCLSCGIGLKLLKNN